MSRDTESYDLDSLSRRSQVQSSSDGFSTVREKDQLLDRKRRVDLQTAVKLRIAAIGVSWISAIFSLAQGVVAIVFALKENSASIFGFGLAATLDSVSSFVVLWRFHSGEVYSESREIKACFIIGVLFLISSFLLAGKTIYAMVHELKESKVRLLMVLTLVNGICNMIFGILKITIGHKLESKSLMTDSVITFTGSVMSFAAYLALELYLHNHTLWYIDSIFGIGCSVFLLLFAFKLFWDTYKQKKESTT